MDQIATAAKMAGDWWAKRLSSEHGDKRDAFATAVATRVEDALRKRDGGIYTEVDYDPQGLMLEAVRSVIDPECRGMMFSARGILPQKHELYVTPDRLVPKEGYGNWTAEIVVPNAGGNATERSEGRVDHNVVRLTRLQMAIIEYMARLGGDHVFISMTTAPPPDSALSGFTWAGVNLSLRALTRRGVIRSSGANHGFYSLTHN